MSLKDFYIRYPHSNEKWTYTKNTWLLWLWDLRHNHHRYVGGASNPTAGKERSDWLELNSEGVWNLLSSSSEAVKALNELNTFIPPQYKLERWGDDMPTLSGTLEEVVLAIQEQNLSPSLKVQRSRWLLSDRFSQACVRFDPFMKPSPYDPLKTAEGKDLLRQLLTAVERTPEGVVEN